MDTIKLLHCAGPGGRIHATAAPYGPNVRPPTVPRTRCGRRLEDLPGWVTGRRVTDGPVSALTCGNCREGLKIDAEQRARHEREQAKRQQEYQDYLRSREWWRLREQVMVRDSRWCQRCDKALATEVHHLTYERTFAERLATCSRSAARATTVSMTRSVSMTCPSEHGRYRTSPGVA